MFSDSGPLTAIVGRPPDVVALWLDGTPVPEWVWLTERPVVGVVPDLRRLPPDRGTLSFCDVVVANPTDATRLQAIGMPSVIPAAVAEPWAAPVDKDGVHDLVVYGDDSAAGRWLAPLITLSRSFSVRWADPADGRTGRAALVVASEGLLAAAVQAWAGGATMFFATENKDSALAFSDGAAVACTPDDLCGKFRAWRESGNASPPRGDAAALLSVAVRQATAQLGMQAGRLGRRTRPTAAPAAVVLSADPPGEGNRTAGVAAAAAATHAIAYADRAARLTRLLAELGDERPLSRSECDTPVPQDAGAAHAAWMAATWPGDGGPEAEANEKRRVLRWWAAAALASVTGRITDYEAVVLEWPERPASRAALGCALARAGRPSEAAKQLEAAVSATPLDADAARALFHALLEAGDTEGAAGVAAARRVAARIAPDAIRPEPWLILSATSRFMPLTRDEFAGRYSRAADTTAGVIAALSDHIRARRIRSLQAWVGGPADQHDLAAVTGRDLTSVWSEARRAYASLRPGGCLVWSTPGADDGWAMAYEVADGAGFQEEVYHALGTPASFLFKGPARTDGGPVSVAWAGEFAAEYSLAAVNRAVCEELRARGHTVTSGPGRADILVRHAYPPDLSAPPAGVPLVVFVPWEFGSLPRAWVGPLREHAAEAWAYSAAVRDCLVAAGVPGERVHVIPLGVDVDRFRPGLSPLPLATRKGTRFLFVGGTIFRKGFDVLLAAYRAAFRREDDVCLVVKEDQAGGAYSGQTATEAIQRFRDAPDAPEVEYLTARLSDDEMPRLYAACRVLAHPYRGEGFGLPVLEAMACGLPVIVTAGGATDDFCPPAAAYRIPAARVLLPDARVGPWETAGRPWLLEPDAATVAAALQRVHERPDEARSVGAAGRRAALAFPWAATAAAIERRARALRTIAPTVARPARVSLTMIVRDEERNLPDCLAGLADLFHEIVVVDTGSIDGSRAVAAGLGAAVAEVPWADSFADARNAALDRATGDYVFWLDADDRLNPANREQLRALFAGLPTVGGPAYVMKCRCVTDAAGCSPTVVDHVRLFPRRPDVRWEFRVHEQVLPALRGAGVEVRWAEVVIEHVGYADPAVRRGKLTRDLRLLEAELRDRPGHPFALFNLGSVRHELGEYAAALDCLERSLAGSDPRDSIVRKLYALAADCHARLGRPDAARAAVSAGLGHYPDDAELLYLDAAARRAIGDPLGAERSIRRLLAAAQGHHFASVDAGLLGAKAMHQLALACRDQGRVDDAAAAWRQAAALEPGFRPAYRGLGELALESGSPELLVEAVAGLGDAPAEVAVLQARRYLAQSDYQAARAMLCIAVRDHPDNLPLRRLLCDAYLGDRLDPAAAEQALREILRLAPGDPEALLQLDKLLGGRRKTSPQSLSEAQAGGAIE